MDEAKRRCALCLHCQPRPARRSRLQRDSSQSHGIRRRQSAPNRLPHPTRPRRHCSHPMWRLPYPYRRYRLLQHHTSRTCRHGHHARISDERRRRPYLGRWIDLQRQRHRAFLSLRLAHQPKPAHLQTLARPVVHRRVRWTRRNERLYDRQWFWLQDERRKSVFHRQQYARSHARSQRFRTLKQRHSNRQPHHGRTFLARRLRGQSRNRECAF